MIYNPLRKIRLLPEKTSPPNKKTTMSFCFYFPTKLADEPRGHFVRSHWFALHGLLRLASQPLQGERFCMFLSDPTGEDFWIGRPVSEVCSPFLSKRNTIRRFFSEECST